MKKVIVTILIIALQPWSAFAQLDTLIFGDASKRLGTNYYNYADPFKENIEVYVWGGVKNAGVYLVPVGTDLFRLLTLTGGAPDESMYETFKLIRPKVKTGTMSADSAYVFNFKDFFDPDKKVGSYTKRNPILQAGDMIIFPAKPSPGFWDVTQRVVTIVVLPLISLATLAITYLTYTNTR
jgi:hypothetical protein